MKLIMLISNVQLHVWLVYGKFLQGWPYTPEKRDQEVLFLCALSAFASKAGEQYEQCQIQALAE